MYMISGQYNEGIIWWENEIMKKLYDKESTWLLDYIVKKLDNMIKRLHIKGTV